jgi:hypothetical protein
MEEGRNGQGDVQVDDEGVGVLRKRNGTEQNGTEWNDTKQKGREQKKGREGSRKRERRRLKMVGER